MMHASLQQGRSSLGMRTRRYMWMCLAIGVCCLGMQSPGWARSKTIKIATLAPKGSTWAEAFRFAQQKLKRKADGRLRARLYTGGVAGDEPDMVRKMRVGQLQGAAITSVGLAEIQPALLALQAPGLFSSWEELDAVRTLLKDRFAALLAEKGFVVMAWGDVGFDHVFSRTQVHKPDDLKKTKPWCWSHDGNYQGWYAAAGVQPVSLSVPEVLPGLQTGLIDAFATPPLVAVSLQWFQKMAYVLDLPIAVTLGAVVLTQKFLDTLPAQDQAVLRALGEEMTQELAPKVRGDHDKAMAAVRAAGIEVTTPSQEDRQAWQALGARAEAQISGTVFPAEILAEIKTALAQVRKAPQASTAE